jgi:hypothetical protein
LNESKLRSALTKILTHELPLAKILRHEDKYTAGIPDLSVTWRGYTIWLEVKYANPVLRRGKEIQQYTTNWLMQQGLCWYVIYYETIMGRQVMLLDPKYIKEKDWVVQGEGVVSGFDHRAVANFIRRYHNNDLR